MSKLNYDQLNDLYGSAPYEELEKETVRLLLHIKDIKDELKVTQKASGEAVKIMEEKISFIIEILRDKEDNKRETNKNLIDSLVDDE